ncbi:MAG: hypothetical protein K6E51_02675 [Treponema sp.]|nr:hypothetical protein [Treponema sp.]
MTEIQAGKLLAEIKAVKKELELIALRLSMVGCPQKTITERQFFYIKRLDVLRRKQKIQGVKNAYHEKKL